MQVTPFHLPGLLLVQLTFYRDSRGFFVERFRAERFQQHGLPTTFAQDSHSRSVARVLRGLHYQPSQGKLVGVVRGRIWDVAVDIRPDSPTYGKSAGVELTDESGLLLWMPPGFAHGFCVLGDEPADVVYKSTEAYNPNSEGGIRWNDPTLAIRWPIENPIVSERDQKLISFADYKAPAEFRTR